MQRPKNSLAFLSLIPCLALSGCIIHADVGNGNITSRPVQVSAFTQIESRGSLDLNIVGGPTQSVTILCDDNLQGRVQSSVQNGTLLISTDSIGGGFPVHGCEAEIVVPALTAVKGHGSGDIEVGALPCETIELATHGSGDIYFSGSCLNVVAQSIGSGDMSVKGTTNTLSIESRGSGDVEADLMIAQSAVVTSSGSGDLEVYAVQSIVATSQGSGDIDILGSPVHRQISSTGSGDVGFE